MYRSLRCMIHRAYSSYLTTRGVHIFSVGQCPRLRRSCYGELLVKYSAFRPSCMAHRGRHLHTSTALDAGKLKNTKKKIIKKVRFNKKSIKSSWEVIGIRPNMTVSEIADAMGKDVDHVYEALLFIPGSDNYDSPNSVIKDIKVIKDILDKSGYRWKIEAEKKTAKKENKDVFRRPSPDPSVLVKRAPVVTIMGHVDHGKTTLLDALRKSHIVDQEFGGITQHIGAFSVTLQTGDCITFLDTPGHAAFSAMRARGAQVTDIIVLVVAAEDGVMKQTVESIQHAREAGVPLIVAVNKIDKFEASVQDTKEMLIQQGVEIEDDGGDVPVVPISALKRTNLDQLQETIIALSELLELKGDPTGLVEGAVIESKTDQGKGKVSTMIVQRGTLKKGCFLVAGKAWAKVRNILNDQGKSLREAKPGEAVEVTGWKILPSAGDTVLQVESEARVKEVLHWRMEEDNTRKEMQDYVHIKEKQEAHQREYEELRQQRLERGRRAGAIYGKMKTKEEVETYSGPELSIVLKGDVDGSVDAILDLLNSYDQELCRLSVLQQGVGVVTEPDVDMAALFSGHVYAFNVDVPSKIVQHADKVGVTIHSHNVIYKMVDDLKAELNECVLPTEVEEFVGEANVIQNFIITESKKKVVVAGCRCNKGTLQRLKYFRVKRNGEIVGEGRLISMKHFKEEVANVQSGQECGLAFEDQLIQPEAGDQIICYDMVERKPEIKWDLEF